METKWRYGLMGGAILLITGLFLLPRVVVENTPTDRNLVNAEATAAPDPEAKHPDHHLDLPAEMAERIAYWREQFGDKSLRASAHEQALDSLTALWKPIQRWDSIATYTEQLWLRYPSDDLLARTGNAYYEALGVAASEQAASTIAPKARQYLEQAQAKEPSNLDWQVKIGMTYIPSANPMQGIGMIREVLQENPQHRLALLNLGLLSMRSGQFDKAVERFEQLVALAPEEAKGQFYLGMAYAEAGIKERARTAFTAALQAPDADSLLRQAARNYLANLP